MDNAKILTVEDGVLVRRNRQGLFVREDRNHGGHVFINSSTRTPKPRKATGRTRPGRNDNLGVVFPHRGDDAPRVRTRNGRAAPETPAPKMGRERGPGLLGLGDYQMACPFPDDDHKYFCTAFTWAVPTAYPFEKFGIIQFHPYKTDGMFDWLTGDPLILQACIALGSAAEAARSGTKWSEASARRHGSLCRLINESLDSTTMSLSDALFSAVSCSALYSIWLVNLSSWLAHMKGLEALIHARGGLRNVTPHELNKVSSCNLDGALTFGHAPYLSFYRKLPSLLNLLPGEMKKSISFNFSQQFHACEVDLTLVDIITKVCIFNRIVICCRTAELDIKFDPEQIMEEYYHLIHQLLTHPRPLFRSRNRLPPPQLWSSSSYWSAFEMALRAAALICLRAPTLELLSARQASTNLLVLLFKQLSSILSALRQARRQAMATEQSKSADEFIANARPFLVWMCLLGDVIAVYTNFDQVTLLNQGRSVARQLLVEILSGGSEAGNYIITDDDLRVSREWNIGYIIDGKWDERKTLKRMLEGGLRMMPLHGASSN